MNDPIDDDFSRDVYCLFGLPVDNLTLESTKKLICSKAEQKGPAIWSTINVNWVVQSLHDKEFRQAIRNSDIVTLDGKPLLWLGKLLGYPMVETVPGSTLIQQLHDEKSDKPLSIFLFGGEEGVADLAMHQINHNQGGLRAVGAFNPGFGTLEEMSSDSVIEKINSTHPDILLVALGARKGTQWIEHNRHRLNAKIISHLGATINFLAGTVKRAPQFTQRMGLEWLWRIFQEPKLFRRYGYDGLILLCLIAKHSFGWLQFLSLQKRFRKESASETITQQEYTDKIVLSFGCDIHMAKDSRIRQFFADCVKSGKNVVLDFNQTEFIDCRVAGALLFLEKHLQANNKKLYLVNVSKRIDRLFNFIIISK